MRVALVGTGVQSIPPVGYGGVERTIAEYAGALRSAGHEPVVINRVRHGRSVDEYLFALSVPGLVRAARADIVHASTPVVANALSAARIPFVYTSHSRHWFERRGIRQRFGFWLEQRAVASSRATVALTERLRGEIARRVPGSSGHLSTIPIGVDTDRFRPDPEGRTGRVALGVGVVLPFKRWEAAGSGAGAAGWAFRLAGPTPDPRYAARLRALGAHVELLGELTDSDLAREFARADALVHPSRVEILAGVVLQGLSAGLPVVGAAPVAELVAPEVTGWTAPENASAEALTAFVADRLRALSDPDRRSRMSAAARGSALASYAWPTVVERHIALYRTLSGPGP